MQNGKSQLRVRHGGFLRGIEAFDATLYGIAQVKRLMADHKLECDFEENGMVEAAIQTC